jgi:hypothetical protein
MRRHLMTSPASALVVLAVLLMHGGAFGAYENFEDYAAQLEDYYSANSGTRPHPPG